MRKLIALVAVFGMALLAACGPKLTQEEQNAPPPAGPEAYQGAPEGAVPGRPTQPGPTTTAPAPAPTEGTEGAAPAGEGTAPAGEGAAGTTSTTEGTGGG